MSDDAPDPRWTGFDDAFRAAADIVPELSPDPTARRSVLHLIDDGNYPLALIFAAATVRHSDGRDAALQLAELLVPRIALMLDRPHEPEFESNTVEVEESMRDYQEIDRRLRSVIDAHAAGRAVPPEFRSEVEAWWDDLIADVDVDVDTAIAQAQARLDAPAGGETERFWLHEILIDWLYLDDQWRWQPALVLLAHDRVARAADEMRSAAGYSYDAKAPFADTFRRYADELDAATGAGAA